MSNSLHLGNYSTCRCASHKKHHEVKGKQSAFQSSSMALTDLYRYACKYVQVFFTIHSTNIHKPQSALSNNHVELLASRDVWSFSGPFSRRDVVPATSWHVASGQWARVQSRGGKMLIWNVCKVQKGTVWYSTVYIIHHCMMQTQDQQAKQMEYTAWF